MILYREKTQIRFCINITDTGKREKMLHFEIRYQFNSLFTLGQHSQQQEVYRDMPFCSVLF